MFFHEYFVDFDGNFGVFDESGTFNFVPNKPPPPFSHFCKRPGRLKGRIRYPKSKHLFALDLYPMASIVIFFSLYCHITYGLVN